jgi:hypothetical protein
VRSCISVIALIRWARPCVRRTVWIKDVTVTTPFVATAGSGLGAMRQQGRLRLSGCDGASRQGRPPHRQHRRRPAGAWAMPLKDWGLHLVDVNLTMGDLVTAWWANSRRPIRRRNRRHRPKIPLVVPEASQRLSGTQGTGQKRCGSPGSRTALRASGMTTFVEREGSSPRYFVTLLNTVTPRTAKHQMKPIRNRKNRILAMPAAAPAMPVKPRAPAMMATTARMMRPLQHDAIPRTWPARRELLTISNAALARTVPADLVFDVLAR